MGPKAEELERVFAERIGVSHAISLNSGTTALEVALRFLNLKGTEVLVPTNTFVATANAVIYAGGKPVFVEIEPKTLSISFEDMERKTTSRTRAAIVVHLGGIVVPKLLEIIRWGKRKGITIIEDCAHTLGSSNGQDHQPGKSSLAGAFSFWPTKILTTGTGGMLTTNSHRLAEYAKSLRYHGLVHGNLRKIKYFGNDWCLNEILASVGIEQFKILNQNLKRRRQVFEWYAQALNSVDTIQIPIAFKHSNTNHYKFWVTFKKPIDVFSLHQIMNKRFQIQTEFLYWPPVPLMPLYKGMGQYDWKRYPMSNKALRNHLCLPMHPIMSRRKVDYVVRSLKNAIGQVLYDKEKA